ncbi:HAD family hydrolase [Aquibacillus salsiterrae]|uniref:HAD family hydrolase n=1 Tax=Aquibacillus salsiterrae TaxID=2950439 RepID=A0A9X3WF09_9BACI|nr:HAD family hydrolase [Aquibacillus salsiterrae]MDC3415846.1 HAD family hydrolase [Aquibacillus salsiterrae]
MQTIIFDVDDTLYDQALSFHKTFRKLIDESFTYDEIDKIYRASRKYSETLFDQSEAGEITTFEWQIGRIMMACQDFAIPIDEKNAALFHQTYVSEQKNIEMFPEVAQLLDLLSKEGKQLAVLTNGEEKHQSMKIKQLELEKWIPKQNIFISGTYGHAKPKREIFEIVEQQLGLKKAETVYVGDSYEKDVIGAKKAGWKAIWVNHRKHKLPTNATTKPDKEVHDVKQLLSEFGDSGVVSFS